MNFTLGQNHGFGGLNFSGAQTLVCTAGVAIEKVNVPRAKTGTLTTRTDNDTGTLTMEAGHGIITGDRLDIYWNVAGVAGMRRGMVVGTVAGTSVPIDLGAGDNLPVAASAITAMVPTAIEARFDGDDVAAMALDTGGGPGAAVFTDVSNVALGFLANPLATATAYMVDTWWKNSGRTNPLAGASPVKVFVSHGDGVNARSIKLGVGYN